MTTTITIGNTNDINIHAAYGAWIKEGATDRSWTQYGIVQGIDILEIIARSTTPEKLRFTFLR